MDDLDIHAGDYGHGEMGGDTGGELVGLHVGCRSGRACTICQASEGGIMAADEMHVDVGSSETADAGMFVEVLQALIESNADKDQHGFLTDDDETPFSDSDSD